MMGTSSPIFLEMQMQLCSGLFGTFTWVQHVLQPTPFKAFLVFPHKAPAPYLGSGCASTHCLVLLSQYYLGWPRSPPLSLLSQPQLVSLVPLLFVTIFFLHSGTSDVSSTNHTRSTASPLHTLVLMLAHRLRFWSCSPVYIHSLPCSPVLSLLLAYSTLLLSFLLSILSSWLLPWGLGPAVLSASRQQCVCLSHFRSAAAGGCLWLAVLFNASLALLLFISHLLLKVTCLFIIRKEAVSRLFSQLYLRAQKDMWLKSTHFCNLLSEQVL